MGKARRFPLCLTILLNCVQYSQRTKENKAESIIAEETDVVLLAERYGEKKNITQERLVSYIHSFIPAVNTWSDIKKLYEMAVSKWMKKENL